MTTAALRLFYPGGRSAVFLVSSSDPRKLSRRCVGKVREEARRLGISPLALDYSVLAVKQGV